MSEFAQDIQNFQRYGVYIYNFDNVGNLIFDSSSVNFNQVYISFPIKNIVYDLKKIETMYNTEFEEFIPTVTTTTPVQNVDNLQEQLDVVQSENNTLKLQLDSVISKNESLSLEADQLSTKQVILELRKAAGEGRVDSDFSETFPYTPIRKNKI